MTDYCDTCGQAMDEDEYKDSPVCDICLRLADDEEFDRWLNGEELE